MPLVPDPVPPRVLQQTGRVETNVRASLAHAFSLMDFITDTKHHFTKKYHDYVLYSDMVRNRK